MSNNHFQILPEEMLVNIDFLLYMIRMKCWSEHCMILQHRLKSRLRSNPSLPWDHLALRLRRSCERLNRSRDENIPWTNYMNRKKSWMYHCCTVDSTAVRVFSCGRKKNHFHVLFVHFENKSTSILSCPSYVFTTSVTRPVVNIWACFTRLRVWRRIRQINYMYLNFIPKYL